MSGPERREQLVDVARGVFAERGFEAATIEEIAEAAGVSKPIVYQHFGGKDGLWDEVVERAVTSLVTRIAEGLDTERLSQAAEGSAGGFLAFIEEEADAFRVLLHDGPGDAEGGTLALVIDEIAVQVEGMLGAVFVDRGYDEALAPMYARMLVGAVALVGQWWLDVREPPRDVVARHIVNLTWNGLRHLEHDP